MSTDFTKQIFSDGQTTLQINFTGIKDGQTDISSLGMSIFAYETVTGDTVFTGSLNFSQIKQLYDHLNSISIIRNSSETKSGKFVEADDSVAELIERIKKIDENAVITVLDTLESDKKIVALLKALDSAELDSIAATHKQHIHKVEYENLKQLLDLEANGDIVKEITQYDNLKAYIAKQPEKIFQNWIEKQNFWVFGVEYAKKYDARRIAFFSEADLLMESLDGYLDLIELKRPKPGYDLFQYDKSHKCYYPSPALSQVIGQALFYLQQLDKFKLQLEDEHKFKIIRPRVKIIVGRTNKFNDEQKHALRMLNANLHSIQIFSYDYLISSAEKILSNYEEDNPKPVKV